MNAETYTNTFKAGLGTSIPQHKYCDCPACKSAGKTWTPIGRRGKKPVGKRNT